MSAQLDLAPLPDRARLACSHIVPVDLHTHPRRKDGWYVAVRCPQCGRAVGVTVVAYGTLSTAGGDPPREDGSSAEAAGPYPPAA